MYVKPLLTYTIEGKPKEEKTVRIQDNDLPICNQLPSLIQANIDVLGRESNEESG
jgi:hypothetical protein